MAKPRKRAIKASIAKRLVEPAPVNSSGPGLEIAGRPVRIGDIFIGEHSNYVKVLDIRVKREPQYPQAYAKKDRGPLEDHILVDYSELNDDGTNWSRKHTYPGPEFVRSYDIRVEAPGGDFAAAEAAALQTFLEPAGLEPEADNTFDQRVTTTGNRAHLDVIRAGIAEKQNQIEYINRIVAAKASHLNSLMVSYGEQMSMLKRAIGVLETYLGVWQEVYIIRDGPEAPITTPISLRQQMLFMDEECGDPRKGARGQKGIDWSSVDQFDEWLTAGYNFHRVLPEPKGVVVIRPTRQDRHYSDDMWTQVQTDGQNRMAYLLIRNGERLYRIWLGDTLGPKLFPAADELDRMQARARKEGGGYYQRKADDGKFSYLNNMAMLQGLLDRTQVFNPLPGRINLSDPFTYGGLINFIRDAEPSLAPAGHQPWPEWKDQINAQIVRGSRVFIGDVPWSEYAASRFVRYYQKGSQPPAPSPGVYTVDEIDDTEDFGTKKVRQLVISYNPGDQVAFGPEWLYDPHPRKNNLRWKVHRSDPFLLNYDLITLADLEYYIGSRIERHHFLSMMPLLWDLRDARLSERDWEAHFVRLATARTGRTDESDVWAAVEWWKNRVIWKRPISKNDTLALRMIEQRLKGKAE